ncbi:MAG: STAS domain-containing protein [Lachnospiraceae bacterium]|nr:STAS domain-containing protein [Lachnospiraceae bacterium]
MLNITEEVIDREHILSLEGRLDTVSAVEFDRVMNEHLKGARRIVVDLTKLIYISSAGLRVLISARKFMKERDGLVLRNMSDGVREIFRVTGMIDLFEQE